MRSASRGPGRPPPASSRPRSTGSRPWPKDPDRACRAGINLGFRRPPRGPAHKVWLSYAEAVLPSATPNLVALDLLESIAELGSLGQAATRHGMSQPAVSMRMSQLERSLGVSLLRRSPAG